MNYLVRKGEATVGPYTLAELQQQVQSGSVMLSDLAQSEGMADWALVSQVLGNIPIPASVSHSSTAASGQAVAPPVVPLPYNLHWGILLALEIVTRNIFNFVWALYQANWSRKLDGETKPLVMVAMYPAGLIAGVIATANHNSAIGSILILGGLVAYLIGIFGIRSAMEEYYNSTERYGLTLGGAMTFFFSTVYFQYHINQISKWKKAVVQ